MLVGSPAQCEPDSLLDKVWNNQNPLDFELDYGYEFEKRYPKMEKENRELTEVIFDYLVQEGSDYAVDESGEKLRKRIKKQYECVMEAREEIW